MKRLRFLFRLILLSVAVLSCRAPNRPPEVSWLSGPTVVEPDSAAVFLLVPFDPDDDSVQVELDWDDGSPLLTSGPHASLDTLRFEHAWSKEGEYRLKLRLVDVRSGSAPVRQFARVRCRQGVPALPPRVDSVWGPEWGVPGVSYRFGVRAEDPNGDHIRFQFDWGGGELSEWSRWLRSGQVLRTGRSWGETGEFEVSVRCEDRTGMVTDWYPVTAMTIASPPEIRWEVTIGEPEVMVPIAAVPDEVAVAVVGGVRVFARADGSELAGYEGPSGVLAFSGRPAQGVFVRDRQWLWGFSGGQRWRSAVEDVPLAPVVAPGRVLAPTRDSCFFFEAGTGVRTGHVAAQALNWVSPAVDRQQRLVCLGDSLRRFTADGLLEDVGPTPGFVPEEFIIGPNQFFGSGRVDGARTVLQSFDMRGVRWYHLFGRAPSETGPLAPVSSIEGKVHFACRDSVSALGSCGQLLWSWRPASGSISSGTLCLGRGGELFVGISQPWGGAVVALDSLGRERWRVDLGCGPVAGMVLAADSTIYGIGTVGPALFALWVAQEPASGWPVYRHDASLSGCVAP